MFRLKRWYNQNSKAIWKVTGIVVFFIIVLQTLNYFASKNDNIEYNSNTINIPKKEYSDVSVETDKSILADSNLSNSQINSIDVINEFFSYCNNGKIKEAYNLLTNECKEEMYPNLSEFKEGYYKKLFNGKKRNISINNWNEDIYKIDINDDFLSTGVYSKENTMEDYITIQELGEQLYKLNVNRYIGRKELKKSTDSYNINFNILRKDMYMDYEIYTFQVNNNRDNPILLDNLLEINSMYLQDSNEQRYSAYTHELSGSQLLVKAREKKEISIKYYNKYGSDKKINEIYFSKLILDYNSYINLQNKNLFSNYYSVKINL